MDIITRLNFDPPPSARITVLVGEERAILDQWLPPLPFGWTRGTRDEAPTKSRPWRQLVVVDVENMVDEPMIFREVEGDLEVPSQDRGSGPPVRGRPAL
jgi:hypothetical protein